jgi:Domain of unknown function (DUF4159)
LRPFEFTRIKYQSGDWDTDVRMPSNILNSLVEYTTIPILEKEKQLYLTDKELFKSPFCYLSGHKLVQFSSQESQQLKTYILSGGFLFVDDCNHDIDGLFAKSFEQEIGRIFGKKALVKIPNTHDIYNSFFKFDGPPTTSFELNGWGDDLVHDYLKAVIINGRIGILYSNKDYGCEWDYDFRNKRWLAEDNTKFGINIITYALTH